MFDLHCHFLSDIDDGPMSMSDSLAMAQHAINSGITHSVVTPHLHLGRYENFNEDIKNAFNEFKSILKLNNINLALGYAAEVRVCPDIMTWLSEDKIPFLGNYDGYKILLLEMPHNHIPSGIDNMVHWLIQKNIRPLIAHPERNKEIMANPLKLKPLINSGALLQLTAGAVAGEFGEKCYQTSNYILENGLATILASDAHNLKHRPPELESGRKRAENIIGESKSWDLVLNTPKKISAVQFA